MIKKISFLIQLILVIILSLISAIGIWSIYYCSFADFEQIMFHLYAPLTGAPTDLKGTLLLPVIFFVFSLFSFFFVSTV